MAHKKQLDRLLRVRTLQLNLVRADDARAADKRASEADLAHRIARLAENVAPAPTEGNGFALVAAAHFRSRLHQSAEMAAARSAASSASRSRAARSQDS